ITEGVLYGGDEDLQYHLAVDVSSHGFGGVLYQLKGGREGEVSNAKNRHKESVIMYISQRFGGGEQKYAILEKEVLGALRCLEEARWLVASSKYPVKLYTNRGALT
ncbi:hypothetical protein DFH27DRAFT_461732, partial [Peziza echinospora]